MRFRLLFKAGYCARLILYGNIVKLNWFANIADQFQGHSKVNKFQITMFNLDFVRVKWIFCIINQTSVAKQETNYLNCNLVNNAGLAIKIKVIQGVKVIKPE